MKKQHSHRYTILLWLNIIAAFFLFLSLLAGIVAPSEVAWISVFGLVYPILLCINLSFIFIWFVLSWKKALLSMIILFAGYGNFDNNFSLGGSGKSLQKQDITVVSYNVQGFSHSNDLRLLNITKSDILHFLLKQKPEIVCLQEYRSQNKNLYCPLKNTGKNINARSYYFQSYFGPHQNKLAGLVIYSKYKKLNTGYLKFNGLRTFAIYSDLLVGKDTIRVINVHLASIGLKYNDIKLISGINLNKKNELNHSKRIYRKLVKAHQLHERQIKAIIELLKNSPSRVILCGDFNDTPSSYTYHIAVSFFEDTFIEKGSGFGVTYAGTLPFLRIDFIMMRGRLSCQEFTRSKIKFSDHYPLIAGIKIDKN